MSDDAEARRQRAERLRERIAEVTGKRSGTPDKAPAPPYSVNPDAPRKPPGVRPISPRDFVEERMRELDRDKEE